MKRICILIINLLIFSGVLSAQAPSSFNYQAVARDQGGQPISDQSIAMQISILQGSSEGTMVYQETFTPQTNSFGLINLQIGTGQPVKGLFQSIDWAQGPYFVRVEMDVAGGTNYQQMGVNQLVSVPYALHALSAQNTFSGNYDDLINTPDLQDHVTLPAPQEGDMLFYSEGMWKSIPGGQQDQVLQFKNGMPQWSTVAFGDHDLLPPTVVIESVFSISHNSVTINAEVTHDGGATITGRGMVWSTNENPGMDDELIETEPGTGNFAVTIPGLQPETQYFIRAFATNGLGTTLSDQISVTTEIESTDTTGTVTDSEGNTYNTVLLNDLWWMAENLKVRHYNDGTLIETGFSNSDWIELTSGAWTFFDNDPGMDSISGKLYNWYAATDPRGVCPVGWRLPTDQEIKDLRDHYGGYLQAGGYLKETGTVEDGDGYWKEPNAGATNASGFSARPTGARIHGLFFNRITTAYYWTGDQFDDDFARNFIMVHDTSSLLRQNVHKHYGQAVRCVKN